MAEIHRCRRRRAAPQPSIRIGGNGSARVLTVDTWVNNAGLSIYGKLTEIPMADKRRLFDVNFWGVVHGCRTAVRTMKASGGVLINIGSEVSDRAIPLQGIYSASKHAVKGYTDALRMELEHDRIPSGHAISRRRQHALSNTAEL